MEDSLERRLGRHIHELREKAGIDKTGFCLMCGISRPYLNAIEKGTANMTVRVLERIAKSLGLAASEILAEAERAESPEREG